MLSALRALEDRLSNRAARVECDLAAVGQQLHVLITDNLYDIRQVRAYPDLDDCA